MAYPRRWSDQETERLKKMVKCEQNAKGQGNIDWTKVADYVRTRNNKECRKRWFYVCDPTITKGRWRPDEDERLREAVKLHGTRWGDVAKLVESRHPDQCSKRYNEVLKPNIIRDRWSFVDDDILAKAVRAHGKCWTEISDRYFPQRTPLSIRTHFYQTQKSHERKRRGSCLSCGNGSASRPSSLNQSSTSPSGVSDSQEAYDYQSSPWVPSGCTSSDAATTILPLPEPATCGQPVYEWLSFDWGYKVVHDKSNISSVDGR